MLRRRFLFFVGAGHCGAVVAVSQQDQVVQGSHRRKHLLNERQNLKNKLPWLAFFKSENIFLIFCNNLSIFWVQLTKLTITF